MKKRGLGIILSYSNTFLSMFAGLFLSSFLLNKLGDTNYGIYQSISSFVNYLVLLEFGTGTIMTRNLSACKARGDSKEETQKHISTIWTITNILALLIAIVAVGFYFSLDFVYAETMTHEQIQYGKNIFIFMAVMLVSTFYVQTLNGIMLANEEYTYSSATSIIKVVTRTILLVALISNIKEAIIIAIVDASINVVLAIFGYIYATKKHKVKINFKSFDKGILKSALPMCLALFLQAVINQANNNVDKFILGITIGPEVVSMYSVGLYIYSVFSSLVTIPVSLYSPQVTKDVIGGKEGLELTKSLVQPSRLIVLVGGSVLFGFISAGRQFISLIYGNAYLEAYAIAIILMAPMFLNMTTAMVINVLDVKNKRLARSLILLGTTVFNIVSTIIFIGWWGVIGAAIATCVALILGQVIILGIYYYKVIGIKIFHLYYYAYKGILIYQILGAVAGFFAGYFISNTVISFLVAGFTYVIVAFGGFLLFGKNQTEKNAIKKLIKKIFGKFIKKNKAEETVENINNTESLGGENNERA